MRVVFVNARHRGGRRSEHLHVEISGKSYFVGELAERQSNVRSFTLDQDQFMSNFARVMAVTVASAASRARSADRARSVALMPWLAGSP